jgi:hypothetical protein
MRASNGSNGEKPTPITQQISTDALTVANNLWGVVQVQKEFLEDLHAAKDDSDLKKVHGWLQASSEDRAADTGFLGLQHRTIQSLTTVAENSMKASAYLIGQAMRKELGSAVRQKVPELMDILAGELNILSQQSINEIFASDPLIFLKEESVHLVDRIVARSNKIIWNRAANFLNQSMLEKPAIELVRSTYEQLFTDFVRGYEIQLAKRIRHENSGK